MIVRIAFCNKDFLKICDSSKTSSCVLVLVYRPAVTNTILVDHYHFISLSCFLCVCVALRNSIWTCRRICIFQITKQHKTKLLCRRVCLYIAFLPNISCILICSCLCVFTHFPLYQNLIFRADWVLLSVIIMICNS